jgi:DNA-binding HxlR family transcriptional regulator
MPPVPPPKRHPYDQWAPDARALDLVGDKWTLLIVRDLAAGPRRFVELQRVLPGISTEQLRSRLNRMVADGLLTRQRYREVPPRVDYELTSRARDLMPVLGALAVWGYEWAWGRPREGEAIDVGAIFRLAPGLLGLPASTSGSVACTVTDADRRHYVLIAERGEVRIEEREAPEAEAQVSGTERAWVEAFSPDGSLSALDVSGNTELAEALLTALRNEAPRRAIAAA